MLAQHPVEAARERTMTVAYGSWREIRLALHGPDPIICPVVVQVARAEQLETRAYRVESHPPFDASDDLETAQRTWHSCRSSYPTAQTCRCCLIYYRHVDAILQCALKLLGLRKGWELFNSSPPNSHQPASTKAGAVHKRTYRAHCPGGKACCCEARSRDTQSATASMKART